MGLAVPEVRVEKWGLGNGRRGRSPNLRRGFLTWPIVAQPDVGVCYKRELAERATPRATAVMLRLTAIRPVQKSADFPQPRPRKKPAQAAQDRADEAISRPGDHQARPWSPDSTTKPRTGQKGAPGLR